MAKNETLSTALFMVQHAFVMRYFGQEDANDRLLIINLDRDLAVSPAPIPLLAPPSGRRWQGHFSSEDPRYAGQGAPPVHFDDQHKNARILRHRVCELIPKIFGACLLARCISAGRFVPVQTRKSGLQLGILSRI